MRDVQFHPVSDAPEHVDFQRLARVSGSRRRAVVFFENEGISPGIKRGGVLNVVRHAVEVACDPDNIPEQFEVDLGPLDFNDNVRWHNLKGTRTSRPVITDRDFVDRDRRAADQDRRAVADGCRRPPQLRRAPAKGGGQGRPGASRRAKAAAKKKITPTPRHAALGRSRQPGARHGAATGTTSASWRST